MFVDASVIISILTNEPDAENFVKELDKATEKQRFTSALAIWEAIVGLFRKKKMPMLEAEVQLKDFIELSHIQILPIHMQETTIALQAFERYGRHRYPDNARNNALNLADCFHYASAKINKISILTKDSGFTFPDIETIGTDF